MKSKRSVLCLAFIFVVSAGELTAQMPNFFAPPPVLIPAKTVLPVAEPVGVPEPAQPAQPAKEGAAKTLYDPAMDNHLVAPAAGNEIGLFGLPIGKVEEALRANGAKNHSYAFGKYSRMHLATYFITVYFDRERRVGGFSVEPKSPYKTIEPEARKFFMDFFMKDCDLSRFEANIGGSRLEIKYKP